MDHLFAMSLALLGVIGFLVWIFRPQAPLPLRIAISVPAIVWLIVYVGVELWRSEPALWSGNAQMHIVTLLLIAGGVYVLVSGKPKPKDGGQQSV